ncbi:sensor histidine kinase [Anaerospora hongkongensis]|nr:ATP-binding protein [Anaerospora hongkongensis]
MRSLTWRITGLMFLSILLTVLLLVYLAEYQMMVHFTNYVAGQQTEGTSGEYMMKSMHGNGQAMAAMMGLPEQVFLESIHRSLYWVGGAMLLAGLLASYLFAQTITVRLRQLNTAVDMIGSGTYGQQVLVESEDEVGRLAKAFNRMSRSLEENIQLRKRLLADIAHELRTPLAIIQGNLEGMIDGVVEKSDEQLRSLHEETVYLNRLIKDLRDLSLAEAGQLKLEKTSTDINTVIVRAIQLLKPLADEKKIDLIMNLQTIPPVVVDVSRINQVLNNLLTNALRYTPGTGTITITSDVVNRRNHSWVEVAVADTGIGICEADLPFIFHHFYRSDKSRDKKSGGSGIGLAIVKQLIETHGGMVEADSSPGEGTVFRLFLPVNDE